MNIANLYQARQRAVMAAIDSGDYVKASELAWRDVRTFATPEPIKTGDKKALTAPTKCGIIKAIKRHVRRWKKQEVKKMKKINIMLTQDAYICGGEYRLHTDSGTPAIGVLYNWYEAIGADSDGNEYRIVWSIREDYDIDTDTDESNACDWDNPEEIIRLDTGDNVTICAKIEW